MMTEGQPHTLPEPLLLPCPACLMHAAPGSAVCPTCGALLVTGSATLRLASGDDTEPLPPWPMGEAILSTHETVTLDMGQAQLLLPITGSLVIGRLSMSDRDAPPDIDLSLYDARNKGVSRKHVLIRRWNYLLFVLDLGSTNGTLLNGRRLQSAHERLLRNGDELQLGQLRLRVRF